MSSYKIKDEDIAAFMEKINDINIGDSQVFFGELKCLICKKKWTRHNRDMIDKYIERGMWYALYELFVIKANHKKFKEYYPETPTIIQRYEIFEKDMRAKAAAGIIMTEEELIEEARIRGIGVIRRNKPDVLEEDQLIRNCLNQDKSSKLDDQKLIENLSCLNKVLKCVNTSDNESSSEESDSDNELVPSDESDSDEELVHNEESSSSDNSEI